MALHCRTSVFVNQSLGTDHLTLEGGGGGERCGGAAVGDFLVSKFLFFLATWWAGYFSPPKCSAGYFFPLLISLQDFFSSKKCRVYIYIMYLHLHCGYCSTSPHMELQSLKML